MKLSSALKGIHGEFELVRSCGAFGIVAYVVAVPAFAAWSIHLGEKFEVISFCAAYAGGFATVIGAVAGAVAVKDRNVATARVTNASVDSSNVTQPTI